MSSDPDRPRPSFRFRDKFSHLKDKLKDKVKDKAYRHNVTIFVHQNLTSSNDTNDHQSSRHGFRQHMHHFKDVLKNKTHYESIKTKVKDKIDDKFDLHDNKTYPKGFYDSLFSPETENDVYLQTALICLWVIAILCIIPTIIIIFLPSKKKKGTTTTTTTSTNMIFFHVFLCELFYLMYILLAIINVAKDFRLGPLLCDVANYGMYVTIPIMQFALLFLSIERLSKHFNLTLTCTKIFTKPYLIQVILCITWVILLALLVTFMFVRQQFNFSFIKDRISSLAPPLVGDVVSKLAARRHHCSVDGRLSSVFKTLIIILFVVLIIKPIVISLGCNLLTPFCCKKNRKKHEIQDDRRITRLVTIFLLLNLFFSFPYYFTSMFNNIFTRIHSTRDTFTIVLKICFILRITNIIFECLAFYMFERNSWNCLRKVFYYGTCKKCPIFNSKPDDDSMYARDRNVRNLIKETRLPSDEEDEDEEEKKKKSEQTTESEPDGDDDDGSFKTKSKKKSTKKKVDNDADQDDDDDDDEEKKLVVKRKSTLIKRATISDEDEENQYTTTKRKSQTKKVESDHDEEEDAEENESKHYSTIKRKSQIKQQESDNDVDEEENKPKTVITKKRKARIEKLASDDDEEENESKAVINTKRKSRIEKSASDDDEEEERKITKRKSRTIQPASDDDQEEERKVTKRTSRTIHRLNDDDDNEEEERKIITTTKRKLRPKVEIEEEIIDKPKVKSTKSRRSDAEIRIPNGKPVSRRPSSSTNVPKPVQRHSNASHTSTKRRSTQASPNESENDAASHASSKMKKRSVSPKPIKKQSTKKIIPRPSSGEQQRSRTASPNDQRSHHYRSRLEASPSSRPTTSTKPHHTTKHSHSTSTKPRKKSPNTHKKKSSKKDRRTRILEMSHDV